ncbi:hypothetical protein [Burkholderia anthina]|uniref:hypothetical protein n=1 Tax=Burkholderia anthina TaxID=179879 RepID=UPI0037BF2231
MKRTLWAPAGPHLMDRDIAMSPRATGDAWRFFGFAMAVSACVAGFRLWLVKSMDAVLE